MRSYQKADIRKPEILENYYQVLLEEGFEGTSIGKIAKRMHIHPSLIIHYFKTKENMTIELVDLLIEKYEAPEFLQFDHIENLEQRFQALMDTVFSFEWSRTIDPGLHFGFYYLSFRNPKIRQAYEAALVSTGEVTNAQEAVYERTSWLIGEYFGLDGIQTLVTKEA